MRSFIFVFISLFLLSSVTNAGMLCCWETSDKSGMSSCHGDSEDQIDMQDIEPSCECDACFQKNILTLSSFKTLSIKENLNGNHIDKQFSIDLEPLYFPPKQFS